MKTLQCIIVIIFILMTMLENVFANTYNHPLSELSRNTNTLMKQGSQNYGQYGLTNKRTNPIRFDNPYNALNDKYIETPTVYKGSAVTFKRDKQGNLYGYDKEGKKIGVYRINPNGTTTQFDTKGNKVNVLK